MGARISVVIPTINEAAGIARTIERIPIDELRRAGHYVEIIVADGGSTDGTTEVAKKLGATIVFEPRPGYGRAYKTTLPRLRSDIVVALDGDGSYPAELIPKFVRFLLDDGSVDFITTNRFGRDGSINISYVNRIGNFVLSLTARILFNIKLRDSQSGMWIFRRSILDSILPQSDGMPFSEEIKVKAFLRLDRVVEAPIPFKRRIGSPKLRLIRDGFMNLLALLRLFVRSKVRGESDW